MSRTNGRIYLAGAMEFSEGFGRGWREEVVDKLNVEGFESYNPVTDEGHILKNHGFKDALEFNKTKLTDYKRFSNCMRDIIRFDMMQISNSDVVLVYVDEGMIRSGGTMGELTAAFYFYRTPVYAVIKEGMDLPQLSGWMLACVDKTFSSFDDAIVAIKKDKNRANVYG